MTTENLERLHKLINSENTKNQYVATCLLRQNQNISNYKELIKKIPVINRINSLKDVYAETNSSKDILIFKQPQNAFEKYINACTLIPKIVQAYNQGWEPNWNNTNEYKYFPYFEKKGLVWSVVADVISWHASSRLPGSHYYQNREILMDACKKFENIYNDWLNYVK
jgi:hypothetical protein